MHLSLKIEVSSESLFGLSFGQCHISLCKYYTNSAQNSTSNVLLKDYIHTSSYYFNFKLQGKEPNSCPHKSKLYTGSSPSYSSVSRLWHNISKGQTFFLYYVRPQKAIRPQGTNTQITWYYILCSKFWIIPTILMGVKEGLKVVNLLAFGLINYIQLN